MTLTRDCKETIRARVQRDAGFREAFLREGIQNFLSDDVGRTSHGTTFELLSPQLRGTAFSTDIPRRSSNRICLPEGDVTCHERE